MFTKSGNHAMPWVDIPRSCIFSPCASTKFAPLTERTPCLPKYVSLPDGSTTEGSLLLSGTLSEELVGSELLSGTLSEELVGSEPLSGTLSVELVGSELLSGTLSVELVGSELLPGTLSEELVGSELLSGTFVAIDEDDEVDEDDEKPLSELSEQPHSRAAARIDDKKILPNGLIFIIKYPFI